MRSKLKVIGWVLFAIVVILVMRFVKQAHNERVMEFPEIILETPMENVFLSSQDIKDRLKNKGVAFEQIKRADLNAGLIEKIILEMPEIEEAKVFSRLDGRWTIQGRIRKPVARVFNRSGESFYIDDKGKIMTLSPIYTARVIPITGYIHDKLGGPDVPEIINNDSLKSISRLPQTYAITNYVCNDAFLHALITQIHIEKNGDFVLIPRVGMQRIVFGNAENESVIEERFEKLKIFYRQAMPFAGWGKYETINLKFKKQIVCTKRSL
jgi:cell division protein FtsQ